MSFGGDTEPGEIDLSCPINWGHPDNAGLALCLSAVDGTAGGAKFLDLCRLGDRTAGGTLVNGPTWVGTPWGQWGLTFTGNGSTATFGKEISVRMLAFWSNWLSVGNRTVFSGNSLNNSVQTDGLGKWLIYDGANRTFATGPSTAGVWDRVVIYWSGSSASLYVSGVWRETISSATITISQISRSSPTGNSFYGSVAGVMMYASAPPDPLAWVARDYQWSRDPATDPRLNRITGRTYFAPLSTTPSVFAPAFGPGWGFAA